MNYELTDEGLRTSDPVIAAMFLEENLIEDDDGGLLSITQEESCNPFTIRNADGEEHDQWLITIPYPTVWQSIQPVEGEACYSWCAFTADNDYPAYYVRGGEWPPYKHKHINACPLTTGKTVGELRDLIARCQEEKM